MPDSRMLINAAQCAILDAVRTPIFVFGHDRILFANRSAEELSGFSREQLSQQPLSRVTDQDIYAGLFGSTGTPAHVEIPLTTADGRQLYVGFAINSVTYDGLPALLATASHITNDMPAEAVQHLLLEEGIAIPNTNIAPRKEIEQALRDSEQRYRQLIDTLPVTIIVLDLETSKLRYVNAAGREMFQNYLPAENPIDLWNSWLDPAQRAEGRERFARLKQGLPAPPIEYHLHFPDGTDRYFSVYTILITFESRSALMTIMSDRSEEKRAAQQAFELNVEREKHQVLEHFMQDASHDLRTPITSLIASGYVAERLAERLLEAIGEVTELFKTAIPEIAATIYERVQANHQSAIRLGTLVEAMLDMLRLDRQETFHLAPRNINVLVQSVIERISQEAQSHHLRLVFHAGENLPLVYLEESEFARVVLHLLENAINFTNPGGEVTVKTYLKNGKVVLEVEDTGIGIEAVDLSRIFERFYRANKARPGQDGRNGLGLSIARRIVEIHGGTIEVESIPGAGSTFRVLVNYLA